jgi:hypothetical protein
VRWKRTWLRDFISPGVSAGLYEASFNGRDRKAAKEKNWVVKKAYALHGSHQGSYVFADKILPQSNPRKRFFSYVDDHLWAVVMLLALFLALVLIPYKRAFSFAASPLLSSNYVGTLPLHAKMEVGDFVDEAHGNRCYWIGHREERRFSISCVKESGSYPNSFKASPGPSKNRPLDPQPSSPLKNPPEPGAVASRDRHSR